MAFRGPMRQHISNALVDFKPIERSSESIGNALDALRKQERRIAIGNALEQGGYQTAAQKAFGGGDLRTGMQFQNALEAQNARAAAAARAAAQAEESRRRFDLSHNLQKQQLNLSRQRMTAQDPREQMKIRMESAAAVGLDPKSRESREYVLTGRISQQMKDNIFSRRAGAAQQMGLQPGTDQFKNFVLTGKVAKPQDDMSKNISAGLQRLDQARKDYGDDQLERSIGPFQGGDTYILSPLARAYGSISNALRGGQNNTTEIRARIAGDVEALAATIKPLIRKPGEGPWTDADQRRLVSVVGDLAEARSAEEYRRSLENVRRRVMSNFGINLPPLPPSNDQKQSDIPSGAIEMLRNDPSLAHHFDEKYGAGAAQRALAQ